MEMCQNSNSGGPDIRLWVTLGAENGTTEVLG